MSDVFAEDTTFAKEPGAVASEHQRLMRQLARATWEKGVAQGSHQRLRTAITLALQLSHGGTDIADIQRLLAAVLEVDDQILQHTVSKDTGPTKDVAKDITPEYPADHPAPGDLGTVPL